jgi:hypothetical protein
MLSNYGQLLCSFSHLLFSFLFTGLVDISVLWGLLSGSPEAHLSLAERLWLILDPAGFQTTSSGMDGCA